MEPMEFLTQITNTNLKDLLNQEALDFISSKVLACGSREELLTFFDRHSDLEIAKIYKSELFDMATKLGYEI